MALRTEIQSVDNLKQIFVEQLLSNTDNITKISPGSVVNGIAYGVAKLGQISLKEIALLESRLFPNTATGGELDEIAARTGIAARLENSSSSTYLRVIGAVGTLYQAGVNYFSGNHGVAFELTQNEVIPASGFAYIKVRSLTTGSSTNVPAGSIVAVTPVPEGHVHCVNEYMATGGRDFETDEAFRDRIYQGPNVLARETTEAIAQLLMTVNSNVLRVLFGGLNQNGQTILYILTQNGIAFTSGELESFSLALRSRFSLRNISQNFTIIDQFELRNALEQFIDISARVKINTTDIDTARKEIQASLAKYLNSAYVIRQTIQWTSLFQIIQSHPAVISVDDKHFFPQVDISADYNSIPRIRGFLLLNSAGVVLSSGIDGISPVFYPSTADFSYQKTMFSENFS